MLLEKLSDDELHEKLLELAARERRITVEILEHLREVEFRRLYAERGYASLYEYCIRELKYSEGAAYRRISAMRALNDNPELADKIEQGQITVSVVSQAQSFLKEEYKKNNHYTKEDKSFLFELLKNKSARDVQAELRKISPTSIPRERMRQLTDDETEIRFVAQKELVQKIDRFKELAAPRLRKDHTFARVVDEMADISIKRLDRYSKNKDDEIAFAEESVLDDRFVDHRFNSLTKVARRRASPTSEVTPQQSMKSKRYIPKDVRNFVWNRDQAMCTFVDKKTGQKCTSRFGIEFDHIVPFADGGRSDDVNNLRLLCRAHNQLHAIHSLGDLALKYLDE